jgi:cytidine deaminase
VHQPEELIARDEKEEQIGGQDLSGTFHRADFFIRAWDGEVIRADVERTLAILFGDPFRTPRRDEYGQFQAAGAALRSAELGRQVGAAIATDDGSVVALGANEVPRYKGGSQWDGDPGPGNRDFEIGAQDTNRAHLDDLAGSLTNAVAETVDRLVREGAEEAPESENLLASLRDSLVSELPSDFRAGGLKDLTEFGRAVHAEMDALLDATRRGVRVAGGTLYTTTFPCHNCARHIIGAGIERVVFIEPYAKSRAASLHEDSIVIAHSTPGERLRFEPFVGVAPRRYLEMFDAGWRARLGHVPRAKEGVKHELDKKTALPVFVDSGLEQFRPELPGYRAKELLALDHFNELTAEAEPRENETSKEPSEGTGTPEQQDQRVGEGPEDGESESTDSSDSKGQH